ncbi:hypothetical protein [Salipaludibacillus daqingensis]|uniref:hypothetical protein n=1 Tax=Salipaludibacillus daqingensis TaxID=3041001 RepID=UPI002475D77C|nr:hypothetical protein [Salipaludibacillus daqingensis]
MLQTNKVIKRKIEEAVINSFKSNEVSRHDRCRDVALITSQLMSEHFSKETLLAIGKAYIKDFQYLFPYNPKKNYYHMWVYTDSYEIVDLAISTIHKREDFPICKSEEKISNTWQLLSSNINVLNKPADLLTEPITADNGGIYTPYEVGNWEKLANSLIPMDKEDCQTLDQLMNTASRILNK